jgi:hypothetical protein
MKNQPFLRNKLLFTGGTINPLRLLFPKSGSIPWAEVNFRAALIQAEFLQPLRASNLGLPVAALVGTHGSPCGNAGIEHCNAPSFLW